MKTVTLRTLMALVFPLAIVCCSDATLLFQVEDSVSGKWVWDATVRLQDRTLVSYYQSDAGPIPQRISHLAPGVSTARFSAPGYEPVSVPVILRPGRNRLPQPVRMTGIEIPGLAGFSMFESVEGADLVVQVRPTDSSGRAILNHPCLDLWIGCVVSEQGDAAVRARGQILYRGVLSWRWNSLPESLFRYSAVIPSPGEGGTAALRVIDYVVIVPRPNRISHSEIDAVMESAWQGGLAAGPGSQRLSPSITSALEAQKDQLWYFFSTSWDVKARAQ
jgi:hypothetical protein